VPPPPGTATSPARTGELVRMSSSLFKNDFHMTGRYDEKLFVFCFTLLAQHRSFLWRYLLTGKLFVLLMSITGC
jgi:hypothetical protein